ncbi:MAG: hypothetical protein IJW82_05315 [Clostridia bacterium]|nr:hypothetical protein [Clostridia bacterium]
MKSVNLICKVEITSTLKTVIDELLKFSSKKNGYDFTISICTTESISEDNKKDFPKNVEIKQVGEGQSIDNLVNDTICESKKDYTICCSLADENWEHKITRIIENLDDGLEVCKISYLYAPVNFMVIIKNIFIKMYLFFVNIFTSVSRNINYANPNFQGYSQYAVKIMGSLKSEMFLFRNTNAFLLINQKVLFMKPNKSSKKVEHLLKKKISKNQIVSMAVLMVGILFIILSFPLLLNLYIRAGAVFKFVVFDLLILACSFSYFFINFFQEEVKKFEY